MRSMSGRRLAKPRGFRALWGTSERWGAVISGGVSVNDFARDVGHLPKAQTVRQSNKFQTDLGPLTVGSFSQRGKEGTCVNRDSFAADCKLIQALANRSQPIFCGESCILFKQGEAATGLYVLKSGEATLIRETASGRTIICLRVGPGSLLGLPGIVSNEPYTLTAMVREGAEVRFVTRSQFEDLLLAEPSLNLMVLQVLASEVRSARQAISETASSVQISPQFQAP
jgi:Cyclic nucleotide-binding domain